MAWRGAPPPPAGSPATPHAGADSPREQTAPAGQAPPRATAPRAGFWLILGLAAAFRLPLLWWTEGVDHQFYLELGKLSNFGFYPYLHYWVEYPPLFPWLAVAVYRFALLFPPIVRDEFAATHRLLLGGLLALAELGVVALVYAIGARLAGRDEALRRMALYAALFWPAFVGGGWYDALPALMLFLGLYLLLQGRAGGTGLLAGLGFMTKVFPAILVPVAVKFLPGRRDRLRTILGAAAVTAAVAAPFLWLAPAYFVASYRATLARSPWETVWALAEGYYSYGWVPPLGERFDPATAGAVAYASRLPALPLALAFAALYAALWLRPVARTPRNVVLFTALSTLLFLLYSKGYSPQFILYVLPFVLILLPRRRALGYALGLSAFNFLELPLYFEWLGDVRWVLAVAVIGRTILWLALGWEWLAELWGLRAPGPAFPRALDRRLALAAGLALLVVACPAGALAWQGWTRATYRGHELRPAFDFARRYTDERPRPAFVFADNDLYQQFAPFFGREGDFFLFRPQRAEENTSRAPGLTPEGRRAALEALAGDHGRVILIRKADDWTSRDLTAWLTERARLEASLRVKDVEISAWQPASPGP